MTDVPPPFDALWFRFLVGLIVGLALGSFITMLSYRLPRKIPLIKQSSSFCPTCKTSLKARDLVPFFSWAASGGKCRYCKASVSARYPLIELSTATLCAVAFALIGFQINLAFAAVMIVTGVTLITICLEQ